VYAICQIKLCFFIIDKSMKIVFVSCYFNHYMMPICDELYEKANGDFYFVETEELSVMRKTGGWKEIERPYVVRA